VLLIRRGRDLATVVFGFVALLYVVLFAIVLVRLTMRWPGTSPVELLQLTPVHVCELLTFLLVTAGTAGAGSKSAARVSRWSLTGPTAPPGRRRG
jgi:hypothetical protein